MEVSRIRALRGPNLWSRHTAIEAVVKLEPQDCDLTQLPGFVDRLRERFPQLGALPQSIAQGKVSLAHALERAALALQAEAGCKVSFSRTAKAPEPAVYQIVVEYTEEQVGRMALDLAIELVEAALESKPFDLLEAISRLRETDEDVRLITDCP